MSKQVNDSLDILIDKEDDFDLLKEIINVKNNLSSHIEPQELINEVIKLIDNSEIFDFKAQRNKKYINTKRPLFIIKSNKSDKQMKELYSDLNYITDRYTLVSECVHREIITKLSDYLVHKVKDKNMLENLIGKEVNSKIFEASTLISYLTASIFSINCDFSNNTIYLEYMM